MRIAKKEFFKLIKSTFIWFVFLAFFLLNTVIIYSYVGEKSIRQEMRKMHETILEYGVNLQDVSPKEQVQTKTATTNTEDKTDYMEFYQSYLETYGTMYDNLDMMDILKQKERMYDYHPTGAYGKFINENYEKLQKRVEEIKQSGEDDYGFYPGMVYNIHGFLYGKIGKKLLLEMTVLVILSILFLMDYERIHKTRNLVLVTHTGKQVMRTKALMGLLGGLLYSLLLMAGTYGYFFFHVSFIGLWKVPVASNLITEARGQLTYPFITFWRLSEANYLLLTLLVFMGILLLAAGLSIAIQMLLQNSYLTFLVQCLLFMSLELFAYWNTATFFDVVKAVCNPVVLWITCGAWFMENELSLSFAGNEFLCIGCSGILVMALISIGCFRYKKLEVK